MSRPEDLHYQRWQVAPTIPETLKQGLPNLNPVLLQVLYNRGITEPGKIHAFLQSQHIERDDPFLLADMEKAISRIEQALENDEIIVVYGDFDADGVTATVLLVEALRGLGVERRRIVPYIPDRVDEGYGLNNRALQALRQDGVGLVISVDCGIRSIREVEKAKEIGLDMIITDHHSLGAELPPAVAVINPRRPDSAYPEENLAGVGIAYKLAQALRRALPQRARFEEEAMLDLVAVGTVADLAPLLGENRKLVTDGLKVLNGYRRPGLEALAMVAGLKQGNITAESIAFGLGPRINAAGRLAHAYDAARLLAVNNSRMATDYAQKLDTLNRQRQQLTRSLSEQAEALITAGDPLLFAADPDFLHGVVGLVASHLAQKHYRPAIIVELGKRKSRGSCRSIPEFHITEALDEVEGLLERHGGHAQAAGFTVKNSCLDELRLRLTEIAAERLDDEALTPTLPIDAELPLTDIDWALHGNLDRLEPTGNANAAPIFMSRNVHIYNHRTVGHDNAHLKLEVHDGSGRLKLPCIAFRQGSWLDRLPDRVDLAYTLNANEYQGRRELQLQVQDIRAVEDK